MCNLLVEGKIMSKTGCSSGNGWTDHITSTCRQVSNIRPVNLYSPISCDVRTEGKSFHTLFTQVYRNSVNINLEALQVSAQMWIWFRKSVTDQHPNMRSSHVHRWCLWARHKKLGQAKSKLWPCQEWLGYLTLTFIRIAIFYYFQFEWQLLDWAWGPCSTFGTDSLTGFCQKETRKLFCLKF